MNNQRPLQKSDNPWSVGSELKCYGSRNVLKVSAHSKTVAKWIDKVVVTGINAVCIDHLELVKINKYSTVTYCCMSDE